MSLWFLPKYRGNLHQLQRLGRIELVGVLKTVKEVGYVCPTSLVSWCMLSCSIFSSHTLSLSLPILNFQTLIFNLRCFRGFKPGDKSF
jgi:hypothetical protein